MSPPGPKSSPPVRMGGDVADLARRVDRMDSLEMRIGRIEVKLDHLASLVEKSLPKAKR
jgi:hypothetical protein